MALFSLHSPRFALPRVRRLAALLVGLCALLVALPARAHTVGLSHGEYTLDGSSLRATIRLRSEDLASAAPRADVNGDGVIGGVEIEKESALLHDVVTHRVVATAGTVRCETSSSSIHLDGDDGVAFEIEWACGSGSVELDLGFLVMLPSGHRHLASVSVQGVTRDQLVVPSDTRLEIGDGSQAPPTDHGGSWDLVVDGVLHILGGADHLAFLVGVLLTFAGGGGERPTVGARIGPLVFMLTAFTVGHSAALAMATLGGLAPPTRFVEPAVALSVAYVGIENLASFRLRPRALVTLAFGFVHGFAYASSLLPLGIARDRLPVAVALFNVGVEVGQLVVVLVVLPVLVFTEDKERFPLARKIVAGALLLAGLAWFLQRVLSA